MVVVVGAYHLKGLTENLSEKFEAAVFNVSDCDRSPRTYQNQEEKLYREEKDFALTSKEVFHIYSKNKISTLDNLELFNIAMTARIAHTSKILPKIKNEITLIMRNMCDVIKQAKEPDAIVIAHNLQRTIEAIAHDKKLGADLQRIEIHAAVNESANLIIAKNLVGTLIDIKMKEIQLILTQVRAEVPVLTKIELVNIHRMFTMHKPALAANPGPTAQAAAPAAKKKS